MIKVIILNSNVQRILVLEFLENILFFLLILIKSIIVNINWTCFQLKRTDQTMTLTDVHLTLNCQAVLGSRRSKRMEMTRWEHELLHILYCVTIIQWHICYLYHCWWFIILATWKTDVLQVNSWPKMFCLFVSYRLKTIIHLALSAYDLHLIMNLSTQQTLCNNYYIKLCNNILKT